MAMQLTRAGEYAIKSMLYLALRGSEARVMAGEVAETQNIPVNYVRKILEALARSGLVKSARGCGGGFVLGHPPEKITLRQVIEVMEGPLALNHCLDVAACVNLPTCPVSPIWMEAQRAVEAVLDRYSLADIVHSDALRHKAGLA